MLKRHLIDAALDEHMKWLRSFDTWRVDRFELLRQSNREGAACEGLVARYLRACLDEVRPFEDPSSGGPDFRCTQAEQAFYVEVTSLATEAVEDASGRPDDPHWEGGSPAPISGILRCAVSGKVRQCSTRKDAPILIAVGILHFWESMRVNSGLVEEMLISDVAYEPAVSPSQPVPNQPGEFVTGLQNALFMAIDGNAIAPKRQPVSGVVVFGLGVQPPQVIGVVNGNAHRPFDTGLLPQIRFAEAVIKNERLRIRWDGEGTGTTL
jgi:hypothetical protein